MRIGIIGSGNIGSSLAALFAAAGHDVVMSNSRGPQSIADLAGGPGGRIGVGTVAEAVTGADLVAEAIPFGRYRDLPADLLDGTVLVSASNYYPGRDGAIDLGGRADTELVAAHLPGTRVVKAFNTIYFMHLRTQADGAKPLDERRAIPVAADDGSARRTVLDLVAQIGFGPVDNGGLHEGGLRQMVDTPVYNRDVTAAEARRILGV
jgi:hypothetical protein